MFNQLEILQKYLKNYKKIELLKHIQTPMKIILNVFWVCTYANRLKRKFVTHAL